MRNVDNNRIRCRSVIVLCFFLNTPYYIQHVFASRCEYKTTNTVRIPVSMSPKRRRSGGRGRAKVGRIAVDFYELFNFQWSSIMNEYENGVTQNFYSNNGQSPCDFVNNKQRIDLTFFPSVFRNPVTFDIGARVTCKRFT